VRHAGPASGTWKSYGVGRRPAVEPIAAAGTWTDVSLPVGGPA